MLLGAGQEAQWDERTIVRERWWASREGTLRGAEEPPVEEEVERGEREDGEHSDGAGEHPRARTERTELLGAPEMGRLGTKATRSAH